MQSVQLTRLAQKDLVDIWRYSAQLWGEVQADSYLEAIDHGIRLLRDHPESGMSRHEVREGYRVLFVNHHAIYYLASGSVIRVVRVLHQRMDPQARL